MWRHGDRSYGGSKSQRRRGAEGRSRRGAEDRSRRGVAGPSHGDDEDVRRVEDAAGQKRWSFGGALGVEAN
jgi:hypothetical protein